MLRTLIYLIGTVLVITFLRGVIGLIMKAMADLFRGEQAAQSGSSAKAAAPGMGGELMQDPVCGMYVSPAVSPRRPSAGKTHYFCSEKCRAQYPLAKSEKTA
ncbi:MAG: YHS domain-containing protein [Acidimicrobiia bacterium]|nr:YHS domain-containing protein [Acidimicrobiia bacterium]